MGCVKLFTDASKASLVNSIFIINWIPPEQIISHWYTQLNPDFINKIYKTTVPICRLAVIAKAFGWEILEIDTHIGKDLLGKNYLDHKAILNREYLRTLQLGKLLHEHDIDTLYKKY